MKQRPKILMVDDDKRIILLLQSFLKSEDYELIPELNSYGALQKLQQPAGDMPDLVLTDALMPELDGFGLTKAIKGNPATSHIPVLMVSSLNEVHDKVKALDIGVDDFITKPVDPSELKARVRSLLKVKALHDQEIQTRQALEQSHKALLEASKLREEVEQITRHDLKTPLTSIIGIPRLLLRKDNLTEKQKDLLRIIEQAGYRMLRMVNMSLELYKIERGSYSFKPSPVNIMTVLNQIRTEMLSIQAFKETPLNVYLEGRLVTPEDTFHVLGEDLLCYSMLTNLIRNAMEASPDNEPVVVHLMPGQERHTIKIRNRGAVPEMLRPVFFNKYTTAGKEGGTGLGTYGAKLFAEAQKGIISLDTSEADITTIRLTLPASAPPDTEDEEQSLSE